MKFLTDKLTICGDPHVVEDSLEESSELFDLLEEKGNTVVVLGDLLDTKVIINGFCQSLIFNKISSSHLNWVIIVGNHDMYNLENIRAGHSLECLRGLPNVRLVDGPTKIDDLYFMPYVHSKEELKQELKEIPADSTLFGHFEIDSFDYGNGHIHKSDFKADSFKKFKKVISGHFHCMQEKGNILYLGTPRSKNHSETNQQKYLGIFDTKSGEIELEKTSFSQHITFEINVSKGETIPEFSDKDHVRVILKGSEEDVLAYEKLDNINYVDRPDEVITSEDVISETAGCLEQFSKWAEDIEKLDETTISLGLEILKDVS